MKKFPAIVIICGAVGIYAATPYYSLSKLRSAIGARDVTEIERLVDFPALRRNVAGQVMEEYARLTGQADRLGPQVTRLAIGIMISLADPIVERELNAQRLIEFGNDLAKPSSTPELQSAIRYSPSIRLIDGWRAFRHSEYGWRSFALTLPFDSPADAQVRVGLDLQGLTWRATSLELAPATIRRLAEEVRAEQLKPK